MFETDLKSALGWFCRTQTGRNTRTSPCIPCQEMWVRVWCLMRVCSVSLDRLSRVSTRTLISVHQQACYISRGRDVNTASDLRGQRSCVWTREDETSMSLSLLQSQSCCVASAETSDESEGKVYKLRVKYGREDNILQHFYTRASLYQHPDISAQLKILRGAVILI